MKTLIPIVLMGFLLAGCPDAKSPKAPPGVPEPKASMADEPMSLACATALEVSTTGTS